MADATRRYRAATRIPYAQAIVVVVQYAREHPHADFFFGPLDVAAMENSGFVLTGETSAVAALDDLLDRKVPGLYRTEG